MIVAAHRADDSVTGAQGEVRVTFSSPFDDAMCDAWRWPLGPADDIGAISTAITGLLAETPASDVARYAPLAAQAQQLLSPAEMGELFKVIALGRGIASPLSGFGRGDKSHTL